MDLRPHLGLPSNSPVDIEITWPNGTVSYLDSINVNQILSISQTDIPKTKTLDNKSTNSKELFKEITIGVSLGDMWFLRRRAKQ